MIVAGPTCGGISTRMPSIGSRPVSTSQKLRLVCTPSPSGFGHVIIAGSVLSGGRGAGFGAGRRAGGRGAARVCALKRVGRLTLAPA